MTAPVDYSKGEGTIKIEVKDVNSDKIEASHEGSFPKNNTSYEEKEFALDGNVTEGIKEVTLSFAVPEGATQSYAGNFRAPSFVWLNNGAVGGVEDITVNNAVSVEYYNLQGVRVEGGARGTLIRVSTDANGSRKAEKVIVR